MSDMAPEAPGAGLLGHEGYVGERAQELGKPRNVPPVPHANPKVLVVPIQALKAEGAVQACLIQPPWHWQTSISRFADSGNALPHPATLRAIRLPHRINLPLAGPLLPEGCECWGAHMYDQPLTCHFYIEKGPGT